MTNGERCGSISKLAERSAIARYYSTTSGAMKNVEKKDLTNAKSCDMIYRLTARAASEYEQREPKKIK